MTIFDKWNSSIDMDGLMKDIAEADQNGGGEYKEVPVGTYEVKIEKMELKASSKNDPMVSIWFKILTGEFKNSYLFMNQVITRGGQISYMNRFLKSLEAVDDSKVVFVGDYKKYDNLLMDIYEAVDGHLEYLLEYTQNKKGYPVYTIKESYEAES